MTFTSFKYLILILVTAIAYYIFPKKAQNPILLTASIIFYSISMKWYSLLLFASVLVCYFGALLLDRELDNKKRNIISSALILILLLPLFIYKYLGFFDEIAASVFKTSSHNISLILPLGISFYTFGAIGYILDVKNKTINAERKVIYVCLFVAFFPQLLSGPIGRSKKMLPQYNQERTFSQAIISESCVRFFTGLFKKTVIADNIGLIVDNYYELPGAFGTLLPTFFVTVLYGIQIYFDFSGYSDMAVASAGIFGITLPENFNTPYFSGNFSVYWKRWHMSLTSWLSDYIFTPLVWSRWWNKLFHGKNWQNYAPHVLTNILIVFLISGLWHGAAWTYIIWGLIHGLYRIFEEIIQKIKPSKKKVKKKTCIISVIIVFLLCAFAHIFFRSGTLAEAFEIIKYYRVVLSPGMMIDQLYALLSSSLGSDLFRFKIICLIVSLSFGILLDIRTYSLPISNKYHYNPLMTYNTALRRILLILMYFLIIATGQFGVSKFIYFNF